MKSTTNDRPKYKVNTGSKQVNQRTYNDLCDCTVWW